MNLVHVFISTGRFRSFEEMRAYVEETYTEDGDGVPSAFMDEVDLEDYEPMCVECVHAPAPTPLRELLADVSYADRWLPLLPGDRLADAAICVFPPNELGTPEGCSLEYVGAFPTDSRRHDSSI